MNAAQPRPAAVHSPSYAFIAFAVLTVAMLAFGPIAQLSNYHHFADQRGLFGIPNGADVLSNLGFLIVGLYGMRLLARGKPDDPARAAYSVFFASLVFTAFGSSWYHLAPDDARLVWDRLPIATACAALLAAALRDAGAALSDLRGSHVTLAGLLLFAVASVFYWKTSGDLRPYLLLQIAPLLLIPLLQWQSGARLSQRLGFALAIALYVLAKLCELADASLLAALHLVGGHTLKHLLATAAALVLARQFAARVDGNGAEQARA